MPASVRQDPIARRHQAGDGLLVSLVVPVLNEAHRIRGSVLRIAGALESTGLCRRQWEIVIADNGSTDGTREAAGRLQREMTAVRYCYLPNRGRGRALRTAWLESSARILAYCDVDLSTDLRHLQDLVGAIANQGCDIAIGSRLSPGSSTIRGLRRETLSRGYNLLTRFLFQTRVRDMQCGFKAIRREAARVLLPQVQSNRWFFDTELILLAEYSGFRIGEFPVTWMDDTDSRVRVISTVLEDLAGLWRLRRQLVAKVRQIGQAKARLLADRGEPGSPGTPGKQSSGAGW